MKEATPEDLIRSTKPVTLATAKVVAAGNSGNQEDIAAAANMGRNAVTELLTTCKVSDCCKAVEDGKCTIVRYCRFNMIIDKVRRKNSLDRTLFYKGYTRHQK